MALNRIVKQALRDFWNLNVNDLIPFPGDDGYMKALTDAGALFVKSHHTDQGERSKNIVQGLRVQMYLRGVGFPTSEVLHTVDGDLCVERDGYRITVERWIDHVGHNADFSDWKRLGELAGRLHTIQIPNELRDCQSRFEPRKTFDQIQRQIEAHRSNVPEELRTCLDAFCDEAARLPDFDGLPHSLIHTDLTWDNVFKEKNGDLILLDFEGAGVGPSIMDLAEVTTKLCDGPSGSGPWRLQDAQAFYKRYSTHRHLNDEEIQLLPAAHFYHQYYYLADSLSRGDFDFIRRMDARLQRWENDVFGNIKTLISN